MIFAMLLRSIWLPSFTLMWANLDSQSKKRKSTSMTSRFFDGGGGSGEGRSARRWRAIEGASTHDARHDTDDEVHGALPHPNVLDVCEVAEGSAHHLARLAVIAELPCTAPCHQHVARETHGSSR